VHQNWNKVHSGTRMFNWTKKISLSRRGLLSFVCVGLLSFALLLAGTHVHVNRSAVSEHSCGVCALAHAGIAPVASSVLAVRLIATPLATTPAVAAPSLLLSESFWIRPPPAV
jgi:hypothetical protein